MEKSYLDSSESSVYATKSHVGSPFKDDRSQKVIFAKTTTRKGQFAIMAHTRFDKKPYDIVGLLLKLRMCHC